MAGFEARDTMPKMGLVTDLREQWLVRADGQLAHRLQDREISSHLCENRFRNQQIREDFPVALSEQRGLEHEVHQRDMARRRQAEVDAEIAREMAEINLRRQRRQHSADLLQASSSRAPPPLPEPSRVAPDRLPVDINPEELGLSPQELVEMKRRLEQEERDARLARELSHEVEGQDALLADMRYAVEAQDSELARLLQEREYKKLQRAKEKARQKALLKKQQRLAQQQGQTSESTVDLTQHSQTNNVLLDAYSNPRDMIREQNLMREQNGVRLCKSVDSDLHYVEPFEKEQIQSRASALQSKEISRQYYNSQEGGSRDDLDRGLPSPGATQHRQPPPPPLTGKKPRFPEPVSIRPASHYPMDEPEGVSQSYSENNNVYSSTFPPVLGAPPADRDPSKRLSVVSDITPESLAKKKSKQEQKKRKGCKIQ